MVAPLSDLMKSFQDIANDTKISDKAYVFVKNGRAQAEGKVSHWFTGLQVKADGVLALLRELRARYGSEFTHDALAPLLFKFSSGAKQMKVGDLRRFFQAAEQVRLNAVAQSIRDACGDGYDDALAPLSAHIGRNRVVGHAEVHAAVRRQFGERVSSILMHGRSNDYLDSLPELFASARTLSEKLNALRPRAQDAVADFCRRGLMTRKSLKEVLRDRLAPANGGWHNTLKELVNKLPAEGVTIDQAIEICHAADLFRNRSIISRFESEIGDDDVCRLLGLDAMHNDGVELTDAMRQEFLARAEPLKADAERFRAAIGEVFRNAAGEGVQASENFEDDARSMASAYIQAGRLTDADLAAFKEDVRTRALRETNYDFALDYELSRVERHPAWTAEQKAQFKSTMDWLRAEFPGADLFCVKDSAAKIVAKFVSGSASASPQDSAHPLVFLKAAALVDDRIATYALEKTKALAAKFPDGRFHVADVGQALFGDGVRVPEAAQGYVGVQNELDHLYDAAIWQRLKAVMPEAAAAEARRRDQLVAQGMPAAEAAGMAQMMVMNEPDFQNAISCVATAQFGGLGFEAALTHALNKTLPVHLADFGIKPRVTLLGMETPQKAEAQWCQDFERQGEAGGDQRSDIGKTSITVKLANRTVSEHNGKAGLAPGEAALFDSHQPVGKMQTILGALRELCGGNDLLYTTAVAALSQSGIVTYVKATSGVVEGADGKLEHAPLAYVIEKSADGGLVIEAKTPAARQTAVLEARLVIHPNGANEFTKLDVTPLAAQRAQPEEQAAQPEAAGQPEPPAA